MDAISYVAEGFLSMIYIRNMTKSYRDPLESPPNYMEEAMPFFFSMVLLEMLVLQIERQDKSRLTDSLSSLSMGFAQDTLRYTLRGCEGWAYVYIWQHWRLYDVPWDTPAMFWFTMLGVDFGFYWFHRASHEVNVIWASHQVHHSSEFFNLSTALRQSMVQQYFSWVFYLPLAFLGVAPSMLFTHVQFNLLYQFWIHTEVVKSLGPLEHFLNTPSHHRVHHGSNIKYLNKNYGGVLIIWDRLFGTFYWEEESPTYGCVYKIESYDLWTIQWAHFRWIFTDVRQQAGWKNKLKRMFYSPAWVPGTARSGDYSTVPDADPTRPRFDTNPPRWLQAYIFLHCVLYVLPAINFAQNHLVYPVPVALLYSALLLYTLSCVGWLLDGAWFAPLAELLRLVVGFTALAYASWLPASAITAVRVLFAASLVTWMVLGAVTKGANTAKSKLE